MKKIVILIYNLLGGGNELQAYLLADLLESKGKDVKLISVKSANYMPETPLNRTGVISLNSKSKVSAALALKRLLSQITPDVLIAFNSPTSTIAELASLSGRSYKLIVSEKKDVHINETFKSRLRIMMHNLADLVVVNSFEQLNKLEKINTKVAAKTKVIYNGVDLNRFKPRIYADKAESNVCKILVVAQFAYHKNPFKLLEALRNLAQTDLNIEVHWYGTNFFLNGEPTEASACYLVLHEKIEQEGLEDLFYLKPPVGNIEELYSAFDVLCHPSLTEGFSNAIIEGMACGLPVIASKSGDNEKVIEQGVNGFLFNPDSAPGIQAAILDFLKLNKREVEEMGVLNRAKGEALFSSEKMLDAYLQILS